MKLVWALLLLLAVAGAAHAQDRPNVVIMLADNVGYGDIGAYGAGEVRGMPTPRIDSIASQGLRLTQYLVEPACTPSRAALMTGRYSQSGWVSAPSSSGARRTRSRPSEVTLGELFKSQGYATAIAGKWHLGASEQSWPTRQGFDEYRVGVLETTDGTLYRDGMQRAGLPEAAIAAAEPYIWEGEANGNAEEGAALHRGLPPAGRGRHRQGVGRFHPAPGQGEAALLPLRRLDARPLPNAAGARVRGQVAHRGVRRRDHGARPPHRPGAGRHQGRRRRGQHHRALALGQRGGADGGPVRLARRDPTARSAASSATRWKARSAPSA